MKKLLYLFLLLPVLLFAQPRYGVEGIPMCWKIGSVDSNITRYVIISSTGSPVQTIAWENAAGQVINVSGGYLRYGYCDCGGSSGGGNGIYGGSGTLPNALVQVQNTQGIKFVEPGTQNGILIANKANGAAGIALDPTFTDSIRQGLVWKQGTDSAAVGIDKDGRLQLLSNNWVAIGNDQAKIIIRKDDAIVLIKTGNSVYGLADGVPLSGKNNVMLWPNGSASGRFANLDSLVDGRLRKDTTVLVESANAVVDFDFPDTRRFDNVFFVGKGVTDTAQVIFLTPPVPDQFKTVFHVKADSGDVAVRFAASQGVNNKSFYLLKPGQRAEVRGLLDAVAGTELWEVVILWDSLEFPMLKDYNNVLFVSPNGNNASAIKNKITAPWQTLFAAVSAATSGDLIYVMKGTYSTPGGNLWKPGVDWHFENVQAGTTSVGTEYSNGSAALFRATSTGAMRVTGNLRATRFLLVDTADVTVTANGYELGQVYIGAGAVRANINITTKETKSALYVSGSAADVLSNNVVNYKAGTHIPISAAGHYPIMFVNNGSTRPKRNSFHIEIGIVNLSAWADIYPTRGYVQARSVGHAYDSTDIYIKIEKGRFSHPTGWSLLGFAPYSASNGNTLQLHCDDCEFNNFAALSWNAGADFGFTPSNKDLVKITGKYKTYSKSLPLFTANPANPNTTAQRVIFDGEFIATDTTLFVLPAASNYEFRGFYQTYEADDLVIIANWANGAYRPLLKSMLMVTPCVTPIQSSVVTTWYVAGCFENKAITKDPDITFTKEHEY